MKKLSLLIALMLCITITGVYATWTYIEKINVVDESVNHAMNLTSISSSTGYGAFEIDKSTLAMQIDPKPGTSHTTALVVSGEIVVKFTPNTFAPETVKENAIPATFAFTLSNDSWTFDDDNTDAEPAKAIVALNHAGGEEDHNITWTPAGDGTFTFTLTAAQIAPHFTLSEFNLDTVEKYQAFNTALSQGQIVFTVSDGNAD